MQTSIRSETPRLVTISTNPSSTSVPINGGLQIEREVVVTSQMKYPGRRASYSPISPISSPYGHVRAHSQEPRRGNLTRWDSSRAPEKSMRRQSRPCVALDSSDPVRLDTNRDSMRALAEFLMTKEPPPNNWVSMRSDDESSLGAMKKYKMFGSLKKKKKKKVSKAPKYMQLPDVAVSATTLQGSRHIAISIPLEHDYPELKRPSLEPNKRPKSAPRLYGSDKGTVVVLKPLVEVRESNSFSPPLTNNGNSAEIGRIRPTSVVTPPINVLGIEATRTLEKYYRQQHQQQVSKESKRPETSRGRAIGTDDSGAAFKPEKPSTGTIYSSLASSQAPGHSQGISGSSITPEMFPVARLSSDLPPRKSSRSTIPASIEKELRIESAKIAATLAKGQQNLKSSNASLRSDSSHAPTVFGTGTAETASIIHSPGPQYFSRSSTPSATAAPTKKLPDLPIGAGGQIIRPSTAPLRKSNSGTSEKSAKRTSSVKNNTTELVEATQESRQERVKARKQRDIDAIRAREDDPSPLSPLKPKTSRSSKHKSSQDSVSRRGPMSMSPIMLVANLPPFTGVVLASDLPSPPPPTTTHRNSKRASTSSTSTIMRVHTPPRSIHENESFLSDSDTIPHPRPRPHSKSRRASSNSPNLNLNSSSHHTLDARRQERRSRRNMTLHEKELDLRLNKIERDNALLLHTLSGIASSFGQLNRLVPARREQLGMEPLMRELSGGREKERVGYGGY